MAQANIPITTRRVQTPLPRPQQPVRPCAHCGRPTRRRDGYCERSCAAAAIVRRGAEELAARPRMNAAELATLKDQLGW